MIPLIEIKDQELLEFNDLRESELNFTDKRYFTNLKIVKALVKVIKKVIGISIDFNVQFTVELTCARCLSNFRQKFNENLHLDYVAGKDPLLTMEKVELKRGDIDKVYYTGPNIDLSIGIRETIVLAIPPVPLCKKECKGLCPVCGKNLNDGTCNCKVSKSGLFTPRVKDV
ncbi:MAG: DUF177 domain-containing protein [candidate division WOR-3 bacterium]